MSLPFDGLKAARTGLVDMGNISFYDNTSPPNPPTPPIFNVWELAQYRESFSEIVLNVTWAQLQSSQNALDTSFIDSALAQVRPRRSVASGPPTTSTPGTACRTRSPPSSTTPR